MTPKSVTAFQEWFDRRSADIAKQIERGNLDESVVREISDKVSTLNPLLRWEIGPWTEGLFFAFGCSGRKDALRIGRSAVQKLSAPSGWVFLPAKPRKEAQRQLVIRTKGAPTVINFEKWRYSLLEFPDSKLLVQLQPQPVLSSLSADEQEGLGWMVVEFELGEELTIDEVGGVEIVHKAGSPIRELFGQVQTIHGAADQAMGSQDGTSCS